MYSINNDTEAYFLELEGVEDINPGYIGGHQDHPTYEMICTGNTGHVEAIEIMYDPKKISYLNLLDSRIFTSFLLLSLNSIFAFKCLASFSAPNPLIPAPKIAIF